MLMGGISYLSLFLAAQTHMVPLRQLLVSTRKKPSPIRSLSHDCRGCKKMGSSLCRNAIIGEVTHRESRCKRACPLSANS